MTKVPEYTVIPDKPITSQVVPILTYHSLDRSGSVISTDPSSFRRQMLLFKQWGYQVVALNDLFDCWEGKCRHLSRLVALTFDDGFANFVDHAAPILIELGFRATIFVVAGRCGGWNDWSDKTFTIPKMPLLTWSSLSDLVEHGFEIGAHTMTHSDLTQISMERVVWEIAAAQQTLQDKCGSSVSAFAYPYGRARAEHRYVVRQLYRGACSTELGLSCRCTDRSWLRRIDMYYFNSERLFRYFPTVLGRTYLALRKVGRFCRALASRFPNISPSICLGR